MEHSNLGILPEPVFLAGFSHRADFTVYREGKLRIFSQHRVTYSHSNRRRRTVGFNQAVELVPLLLTAVFSALRTLALLNRGYVGYATSGLVLACGLVPVATNCYRLSTVSSYVYVNDPTLGASCYGFSGLRAAVNTRILLEYGSIYFILALALNVAQLLFSTVQALAPAGPIAVLQPILISRFIINLRNAEPGSGGNHNSGADSFSRFSVPQFRMPALAAESIIGPMSEPLDFHQRDLLLGEDEGDYGDESREAATDERGSEAGPSASHVYSTDHGDVGEEARGSGLIA
ncbi:hypothetical protein NM688_g7070 [Phlebia brevispora]|uniref:Uncharacterized protein n=1 Tax=Phlebia brevispora TaxID=194682 RepID=A0ACC1S9G7_9APHY|nr:hypothetical protein NM688_g7070 [Phlebia brevispora]